MSAKASIQLLWVGQTGTQIITLEEIISDGERTVETGDLAPATVTRVDVSFALARLKGFAMGIKVRRQRIETSIAEIRRHMDLKRDEVAEAYRELKRYEVTKAAREKRERLETERRDQATLDEISINQHQRKGEGLI